MPVTVTTTFQPGDFHFTNREVMREIGLLARETIRRRTATGLAADGLPFAPYSPGYLKAKAKALGPSSVATVNLTVSGGMLNALQIVEVTDNSVTLGFQ